MIRSLRPNSDGAEIEHILEALRNEVVPPTPERELDHWKLAKETVMRDGVLIEQNAIAVPVFKDMRPLSQPNPMARAISTGCLSSLIQSRLMT